MYMYSRIYFRGVDFLMTNPPEDEAKKVAREYVDKLNQEHDAWATDEFDTTEDRECPHCGHNPNKAHIAGQSVGYQRALEEVNEEILKIGLTLNNDTLIKLGTILTNLSALNNLKSKGGV